MNEAIGQTGPFETEPSQTGPFQTEPFQTETLLPPQEAAWAKQPLRLQDYLDLTMGTG